MALKGVLRDQRENLLQLPLVVDVFGKDVFVQRVPRRTVDEQHVSLDVVPRQLAEKIPPPLPDGGRAGAVLQLVPRPEDRPLRPRIEPLGIEQGALVVVAQQADLALHDLVDHFARVGTIADQIAEAVDLGNALVPNVGQHRLEALDVAVNIADEGSFHAFRLSATRQAAKVAIDTVRPKLPFTVYCYILGRSSRDASCGSLANPPC